MAGTYVSSIRPRSSGYRRPPVRGAGRRGSSGGTQPTWDDYYQGQAEKAAGAGRAAQAYRQAATGDLFPGGGVSFAGLQAAVGGGGRGFGGADGARVAPVARVAPIDTSAADAATFARAKDIAGQTGRASLESLRGLLGETGQLGGGYEGQATRDIVESAAGQVGDITRAQAIQGTERAYQTALANQQAGLTQRGQDIQAQDAAAQRALARTQLQFQQAQLRSQQQLDLLRLALQQTPGSGQLVY